MRMGNSGKPGSPDKSESARQTTGRCSQRLCSLGLMIMLASPALASPEQDAAKPNTGSAPDPALLEFLGTFQTADGKSVDPATFEDDHGSTKDTKTDSGNSSDQNTEVKHDDSN